MSSLAQPATLALPLLSRYSTTETVKRCHHLHSLLLWHCLSFHVIALLRLSRDVITCTACYSGSCCYSTHCTDSCCTLDDCESFCQMNLVTCWWPEQCLNLTHANQTIWQYKVHQPAQQHAGHKVPHQRHFLYHEGTFHIKHVLLVS